MDFTVTVKPSFEEYVRFNRVVRNTLGRRRLKTAVLSVLLLAIVAFLCVMREFVIACAFIGAWAASIALSFAVTRSNIKKAWNTNAALRENETKIRFTESGIEIASSVGQARLDYDRIYRLIETDTHFYLMTAINMGSGFPKDLCTPEQQAFIRAHCAV